jgi:hypothetical protein
MRTFISRSIGLALLALPAFACSEGQVVPVAGDAPSTDAADAIDNDSEASPTTCSDLVDGGLQPFSTPSDPGAGGVLFSISGETLALTGYPFPPANPGDVAFVDGWAITLTEVLVTVDHIKLSSNPDLVAGDESQTGTLVAQVDGPWAVDLHKGGPLTGKGGGGEQAVAIAALSAQNQNGGQAFDPTVRYAFGFDVVAATPCAQNVNLDSQGTTDYREMFQNGWSVLYVGTATFAGTSCTLASGAADSTSPEFAKLPKVVNFKFGFASPTTYINCQNPDNDPAPAFAGEEHQRGIYVYSNKTSIAQLTIHTDHPFWDSVIHDSPLHFDQIAAQYVDSTDDSGLIAPTATLDDIANIGVNFLAFTDVENNPLPSRSCLSNYTPQAGAMMHFDPQSVPVDPNADPSVALRDYVDFMTYDQSTQGHLNSDGLCFVKRNYPSPP